MGSNKLTTIQYHHILIGNIIKSQFVNASLLLKWKGVEFIQIQFTTAKSIGLRKANCRGWGRQRDLGVSGRGRGRHSVKAHHFLGWERKKEERNLGLLV